MSVESLPNHMIDHLTADGILGERDPLHIQTHISHLFLTRDRVYKIRKAVRFPFLSFETRDERNADCLREVQLNRRLAPDVYHGVAPIELRDGRYAIGDVVEEIPPEREHLEHCVVMRRLRDGCDAQALLERGELAERHVDAVAELVASFHEAHRLGAPAPWDRDTWRARVEAPIAETVELIEEYAADASEAERAKQLMVRFREVFSEKAEAIERRRIDGRAVEGHGDLQLAHVWFDRDDAPPSIIDCTEFNEDFRKIDAASEVAFHAMDLIYRGGARFAERFLARYAAACDDFDLFRLVDMYAAYRSAVRAKVALLAVADSEITSEQRSAARESADRHLELAEHFLEVRPRGFLVLTCGTVGSGKSTLAREFAAAAEAVIVSSDRTRKRLAGLAPDDHSEAGGAPDEGLYAKDRTEVVYAALLERAKPVVDSGRIAVLDASYTKRSQRDAAREWARERDVACVLLEAQCSEAEARARLEAREKAGTDASDAGPDFLPISLERFEAPNEWPDERRHVIATDADDWQTTVRDLARELRSIRAAESA